MMNMYWEPLDFDLPPLMGRSWYVLWIPPQHPPHDIAEAGDELQYFGRDLLVRGRSIVALISR